MAAARKATKAATTPSRSAAKPSAPLKPIKESFNKTSLINHLATVAGQEPRAVKAVMGALEATMLASVNKKGAARSPCPAC